MKEDVMVCVKAKTDFFGEYFDVPDQVLPEYRRFVSDVYDLGERAVSVQQFESAYVSTGLSDRFNSLVAKCVPRARAMTKEEKAASRSMVKEAMTGRSAAGHIAGTVMDSVQTDARSALHRVTRQKMIQDGTFRDYTVASNRADTARSIGGFIKSRLSKKKDRGEDD